MRTRRMVRMENLVDSTTELCTLDRFLDSNRRLLQATGTLAYPLIMHGKIRQETA